MLYSTVQRKRHIIMRHIALTFASSMLLLLCSAAGSVANDSSAELSVGGLLLTRSADVSLESEDLNISPDIVSVRYRFLNKTAKRVSLTIAFPLPDIDLSEAENYSIPRIDRANFVGFETKVDGKRVDFTINQRAILGSQDVSSIIRSAGLPLLPAGLDPARYSLLSNDLREQLIQQGLLLKSGTDEQDRQLYQPGWTVRTAAVWRQTFEPNRAVVVEHRYHTSLGISFDTILRKGLRQNKAMASEVNRYREDYCISDGFLASLDRLSGNAEANIAKIQERRISYVLKTGANWAGPIRDFKLTVDRQRPDRLVSFCLGQTRTPSPTVTEFTAKNFTPRDDLKILIVGKF
jgi:hypothetical protein